MAEVQHRTFTIEGSGGPVAVQVWEVTGSRRLVLLAHGYGEHSGRYDHLARSLVARGASVWGPDHIGHGASGGEPAVVTDIEAVVDDLHQVTEMALEAHPSLPVVLIGHSMGGLIATRYAQRYGQDLAGLVLSGPLIGRHGLIEMMLTLPEIPEIPIDPTMLSRDAAVGEAYAADPLVYHGPFKRRTLEALQAALAAVDAGPGFGSLPLLYVQGQEDGLVPLDIARPAVERLRGPDFTEHIYEGAKHEVFNEINRDEVVEDVAAFVDRVTKAQA
jgi:alpha-beta hydrolase superfamily lysophospholipase